MNKTKNLIKKLCNLRLAPLSNDGNELVEILKRELNFNVFEYSSGKEINGWVIPKKWEVNKALIKKDDQVIYDGMSHPLGVIGYSKSYSGLIDFEELKNHLYYHANQPDALVYHYKMFYRNWLEDWGFSIPYNLFKDLEPGEYQVELETTHEDDTMKVLEYHIQGESEETITFLAHTCHPGQANDDLSGVAVGIDIMKILSSKNNRYSYKLLLGPEQFTSVFYLNSLSTEELSKLKFGFYLEAVGHDNRLALQKSFYGNTQLDNASVHYLTNEFQNSYIDDFRQVLGNCETIWEAPGYEIPTISLSRAEPAKLKKPFPEYHTSLDNIDIITEKSLEETINTVLGILSIIETNYTIQRKYEGFIALSNPKYDLFIDAHDVSIDNQKEDSWDWQNLMNFIQRYFDNNISILDIAMKHNINHIDLYNYLNKFERKNLINFQEIK